MKNALLTIWQFPQIIIGYLLRLYYGYDYLMTKDDVTICFSSKMHGGISLGNVVIVHSHIYSWNPLPLETLTVRHELGHCKQSKILGWFYLLIIGLPSALHALLYKRDENDPNKYYKFYTEAWADKLSGIKR